MMIKALTRCTLLALVLFSSAAAAEPIKLKLAFITSDRSDLYLYVIKPFVDTVNTEANGLIEIEVYFSGVLGGGLPQRPQLVLDGLPDMASFVSAHFQLRFPDDAVLELPACFMTRVRPLFPTLGLSVPMRSGDTKIFSWSEHSPPGLETSTAANA